MAIDMGNSRRNQSPAEPALQDSRRPSTAEAKAGERRRSGADDKTVTGASQLTTRQSIVPVSLVTILFFLWGFAYGLLDVLNAHFQATLGITQGKSAGLQAAYFGCVLPTLSASNQTMR